MEEACERAWYDLSPLLSAPPEDEKEREREREEGRKEGGKEREKEKKIQEAIKRESLIAPLPWKMIISVGYR